jgi:hypothetical protein
VGNSVSADAAARQALDHITELRNAAEYFLGGIHWAARNEIQAARAALRLADVLRKLDEASLQSFPRRTQHAARHLRELFHCIMDRWGWSQAIGPDGVRFIQERKEWHDRELLRPFLTTALSCDDGYRHRGEKVPLRVADPAGWGEKLGLSPTIPFEEAKATFEERSSRYYSTPIIAGPWHEWTDDEGEGLSTANAEIAECAEELMRRCYPLRSGQHGGGGAIPAHAPSRRAGPVSEQETISELPGSEAVEAVQCRLCGYRYRATTETDPCPMCLDVTEGPPSWLWDQYEKAGSDDERRAVATRIVALLQSDLTEAVKLGGWWLDSLTPIERTADAPVTTNAELYDQFYGFASERLRRSVNVAKRVQDDLPGDLPFGVGVITSITDRLWNMPVMAVPANTESLVADLQRLTDLLARIIADYAVTRERIAKGTLYPWASVLKSNAPALSAPETKAPTPQRMPAENRALAEAPADATSGKRTLEAPGTRPAVVLDKPRARPKVRGQEVEALTPPRANVIMALLKAWPKSLSKAELPKRSGHPDAVNLLKEVAKLPGWDSAIELPGSKGRGRGYRIADW